MKTSEKPTQVCAHVRNSEKEEEIALAGVTLPMLLSWWVAEGLCLPPGQERSRGRKEKEFTNTTICALSRFPPEKVLDVAGGLATCSGMVLRKGRPSTALSRLIRNCGFQTQATLPHVL